MARPTKHAVVIPTDAKQPQDYRSAKAEASGEPGVVVVEFDGESYEFADDKATSIEFIEKTADMLASGMDERPIMLMRVLRELLGPNQWAEFKKRHPQVTDAFRFWNTLDDAAGKSASSQ